MLVPSRFDVCRSCPVLEGYGQTECYGASCVTSPSDRASLGHVGGPLPCNELKLVSVPDMEYLITDRFHGRVIADDGTIVNPGMQHHCIALPDRVLL